MSKMNQTQLAKACNALASAWNNISKNGPVYGITNPATGNKIEVQIDWEDLCELFPDTRFEFSNRYCKEYPWEARITVEGVVAFALLTEAQKDEAQDKEAE